MNKNIPLLIAFFSLSVSFTLFGANPVATINSPVSGNVSNIYQNGSFDVPVVITVTDADHDLLSWRFFRNGLDWVDGTTEVTNFTVWIELTLGVANGTVRTFQVDATDRANHTTTSTAVTITVRNLDVSMNVRQINASANQTVTFTSIIPFALTQTITIQNLAGQTVRTLISNVSRPTAGNYTDIWNGRNSSGAIVPDGAYFYVTTVSVNNFTMDLRNVDFNVGSTAFFPTLPATSDPFKNNPFTATFTLAQPTVVSFAFGRSDRAGCIPPDFCPVLGEYRESGSQTFVWNGLDPTGAYRSDVKGMAAVTGTMGRSAVIVVGTKSTITNVNVTPYISSPYRGSQTVSFSFTTYLSQAATITISYMNLNSQSVLRTTTQTGISPGIFSTTWNGKANNNMFVAPGPYKVTVAIQDPLGNLLKRDALTNIRY